MELKDKLASESTEQLKQRRRNAAAAFDQHAGTPKGDEADSMLRAIDEELDARSLPGSIASFLDHYPDGFEDAKYWKQEARDKRAASQACRTLLSPEAFLALDRGDAAPLLDAVKAVVGMTNLIQGSFEKPQLFESIQAPQNSPNFLRALRDLLHGSGDTPDRLERFSDYMHTIGRRKWTYGTYFLFLSDPVTCMFVKPESLKKAMDIASFDMEYGAEPTAERYAQILAFARRIERKLKERRDRRLGPKDLIDVQSFIWHMAPTGKWAK